MPVKHFLAGIFCFSFTCGIACSAENHAVGKRIANGMVLIPAGNFTMGSDNAENDALWHGANALNPYGSNDKLYIDEHPAHKVTLPRFPDGQI